jgi:hypothetical protein
LEQLLFSDFWEGKSQKKPLTQKRSLRFINPNRPQISPGTLYLSLIFRLVAEGNAGNEKKKKKSELFIPLVAILRFHSFYV